MDSSITTSDGVRLRRRLDRPPGLPLAVIVLVHGLGDHVDGIPYATAGAALAARGFLVHRLELRGHGESGGPRTYVGSFGEFRADLLAFVERVRSESPHVPLFLVGVSLGGLIVTNFALHQGDGLAGVVAVAPALGETGGSPLLLALLPVLARLVPRVRLDPKLDLDKLTRDRVMLKAYVEDDPLYQRRITPRLAAETFSAIAATRARAGEFRVPLLILHGTADTVTSPAGSQSYHDAAGGADKTYRAYAGALHNLFVETNREEVFDDIASWIRARVTADHSDN
jgi:alpha-beta hydrolase superfamily lysophospholipase